MSAAMQFIRLNTKGECIVCHRPTYHVTRDGARCHVACYQHPDVGVVSGS